MGTDLWTFEKKALAKGFSRVAGVDEAGRGPLAGPVVSAAVVLPYDFSVAGVTDSKKLSFKRRETLYDQIYQNALAVGIGIIDAVEIDRINILQSSLLAMAISVDNLNPQPDFLLIDGTFPLSTHLAQKPIPRGDQTSISIGAASIVAKVTRDRLMERYHHDYPVFGFSKHKGYPTPAHKTAIKEHGYCPIHRRTFKGVKEFTA
jgi:ribonuclease HII